MKKNIHIPWTDINFQLALSVIWLWDLCTGCVTTGQKNNKQLLWCKVHSFFFFFNLSLHFCLSFPLEMTYWPSAVIFLLAWSFASLSPSSWLIKTMLSWILHVSLYLSYSCRMRQQHIFLSPMTEVLWKLLAADLTALLYHFTAYKTALLQY